MKALLEDFIIYLKRERGASENTLQSYGRDLRRMEDYLQEKEIREAAQIAPADLESYEAFLKDSGKSAATISRNVASIRAFFGYLTNRGILVKDPAAELRPPKVVKKTPVFLKKEEAERLLQSLPQKTPKGIRDRAMLELLYATGLRVSELLGIRLQDVNQKQHMIIIQGTGKTRVVPFDRRSGKYLNRYLNQAREALLEGGTSEFLFVNCQGGPMSRQGFWKLIKRYGREAGIATELTPHVMRHSFAVQALAEGEDLQRLQTILGHSDVATTHSYIGIQSDKNE